MLKGKIPYITFALGVLLITFMELSKPKKFNWSQTFSNTDKNPYGAFATFELLKDIFPKDSLRTNKTSFFDLAYESENSLMFPPNSNVIVINNVVAQNELTTATNEGMNQLELNKLLDYVAKGGTAFIATKSFGKKLPDTLDFKINLKQYAYDELKDSSVYTFQNEKEWQMSSKFVFSVFDSIKNENANILACFNNEPTLIELPFQEGKFLLSTTPKLYSNYFILKKDSLENQPYLLAEKTFNLLPNRLTYWDEYYKKGSQDQLKDKSVLYYVLSQPALRWAIYTGVFTLLILTFVKSKRLQNAIPIVEPEKNLEQDFAETIGMLYNNKADHTDIAKKKVVYWKEYVRSKYHISTSNINKDFEKRLQAKTNFDNRLISELVTQIKQVSGAKSLNKEYLIKFNKNLEQFYKKE